MRRPRCLRASLLADAARSRTARRSTALGPLLSCAYHMFTWDLASGAPVSALGCGALRTYRIAQVLGSLYVGPRARALHASPGEDDTPEGTRRRPSWRH